MYHKINNLFAEIVDVFFRRIVLFDNFTKACTSTYTFMTLYIFLFLCYVFFEFLYI